MDNISGTKDISEKRIKDYIKPFAIVLICAVAFLALFYYSCGEELYSRESDGSIDGYSATNDVGELVSGRTVTQSFTSDTDTIQSIGVMASNYGRMLSSQLYVDVYDVSADCMIATQTVNSADIGVNQYVVLDFSETPLENMRGHELLVKTYSNADSGNAPTVLYNVENKLALIKHVSRNSRLIVDGEETTGVLCINLTGRDSVWTGEHYIEIASAALVFLAIVFWISVLLHIKGRKSLIFNAIEELSRYKFLIKQLVNRDFKVRYKRSLLGVVWSLLNPTLMMLVQFVVFSKLFKFEIENFPLYLLSGTILFNFFNEGVTQALNAIVGNASLITKVYMPKYVYPVTRVLSSTINLLLSLIPLIAVAAITHEEFTKAYLMLPYILICLIVFTIGFGTMMSALMVFFRDMQFLWGVLSMMWMYLTPLFYPISIVPDAIQKYMTLNPMIYYINALRSIVMEGVTPQPIVFLQCTLIAIAMLIVGGMVFRKGQDKFIFYI